MRELIDLEPTQRPEGWKVTRTELPGGKRRVIIRDHGELVYDMTLDADTAPLFAEQFAEGGER